MFRNGEVVRSEVCAKRPFSRSIDTKDADHGPPQQQQERPQPPPPKKTRTTVAERVAGACKAYGECNDAATMVGLGKHLDALMEDCDDDQKKMLSSVYNAAVERANEGAN
jgi:hypothetical protein